MSKKVCIETEECLGCGSCVELCPEVFRFDDETEKAFVLMPESPKKVCTNSHPSEPLSLSRVSKAFSCSEGSSFPCLSG